MTCRSRSLGRTVLRCLLTLFAATSEVQAQSAEARSTWQLAIENDLLALRGSGAPPDFDYTHGTRITFASSGAPTWTRRLVGRLPACRGAAARRSGCIAVAITAGQEIFTPRRDSTHPIAGERPYAGWLFATGAVHHLKGARTRSLGLTVGVTGPPSLAEVVQGAIHRMLHNAPQRGWARQVPGRAGIALDLEEEHARQFRLGDRVSAIGSARGGLSTGSVRSALRTDVALEVGRAAGQLQWSPAQPGLARPLGWHLRSNFRQEFILHNLLLAGADGIEPPMPERLVPQGELCLGFRARSGAIRYCHVRRGREYRAQPDAHSYGALTLSLNRAY